MKRKIFVLLAVFIVFVISVELILRFKYGFCDAPLSIYNSDYEYSCAPNQHCERFGKTIIYNSECMRSEEVDTSAVVILGLGDSVLNGFTKSDQDSLATTILCRDLTEKLGRKVQVLNISAPSWGPDNCAAYLRKHGMFNAKMMFLVVSSHDANDVMDFRPVVGVVFGYPKEQYKCAIYEAWDNYIWPRFIKPLIFKNSKSTNQAELDIREQSKRFDPGFKELVQIAKDAGIPFFIYLHPEKPELQRGDYNDQGKSIIAYADSANVRLIKEIDNGIKEDCYADHIHLNDKGQRNMASVLETTILEHFK